MSEIINIEDISEREQKVEEEKYGIDEYLQDHPLKREFDFENGSPLDLLIATVEDSDDNALKEVALLKVIVNSRVSDLIDDYEFWPILNGCALMIKSLKNEAQED